jgi:hypothetical protein
MEDIDEDQGLAPKIFFVAPDPSVVSEPFLETAFLLGYEAYVLADDFGGDLPHRIEILIDTYDELILFFCIDRKGTQEFWVTYLAELQERHGHQIRIGVLYVRSPSPAQDRLVSQRFLLEAGLNAGCVALHPSARRNHQLLLDVLAANQAAGRRKRIRMRCHSPNGVNFLKENGFIDAVLIDLSVSHFSAWFDESDPGWDLGTKLSRVQLRLGGHLLMVNALVGLKRIVQGRPTYVFLFHPETERVGLDDLVKAKVNSIIFHQFRARNEAFLEERFRLRV